MAGEVAPLFQDLAIVLAVAAVSIILFNRFHQPVVLGYLLAGLIVGPHTPPFALVREMETIRTLGDLGVIFLLFALGLEFNLRKLRKVGVVALVSGTLQVALMIWLGYVVGRAFGLEPIGAIFLGAIVSISSTVIIVKAVAEIGELDEEWAQIVFGILIVEDVLAVLMLTVLSAAGGAESLTASALAGVLATFTLFVAMALVIGLLVIPRFITLVARIGMPEVLVVTTIALGFGLAVLGGILGFSPALGAFVMGALIAESKVHHVVEERIAPIRDLFTAIFFVTVGMLVDPVALVSHWPLILAVTAAVIGGKIVAASFATFLAGRDVATSLRVGFGLAQVGEFSFILAALAVAVGATDAPLFVIAVSVAGITAFTTPYLIRHASGATRLLAHVTPRPLRTYASMYSAWTRRLGDVGERDAARKPVTRALGRVVLFAVVAIGIIVTGAASVERVAGLAAERTGHADLALIVGWFAIGLFALPFVYLYARAQLAFAETLADAAMSERAARATDRVNVRTVLVRTFFLAGLVVTSGILLVFASPLAPTIPLLLLVAAAVILTGALLYRSLQAFQARMDDALATALGAEAATPETRADREGLLQLIREKYPWAVSVREIRVPPHAHATPPTIRRLHVRARTGASIVAIHRAGRVVFNPPADSPLLPDDRVALMGDEDQVDAAERLLLAELRTRGDEESPVPRELRVRADSRLAGLTLEALRLPDRVGVTVIGIERGTERIPNPPPDSLVRPDDVLVLLGTAEQFRKAAALNDVVEGDEARA